MGTRNKKKYRLTDTEKFTESKQKYYQNYRYIEENRKEKKNEGRRKKKKGQRKKEKRKKTVGEKERKKQ